MLLLDHKTSKQQPHFPQGAYFPANILWSRLSPGSVHVWNIVNACACVCTLDIKCARIITLIYTILFFPSTLICICFNFSTFCLFSQTFPFPCPFSWGAEMYAHSGYLHYLNCWEPFPLFSNLFSQPPSDFNKLVIAFLCKKLTNEIESAGKDTGNAEQPCSEKRARRFSGIRS